MNRLFLVVGALIVAFRGSAAPIPLYVNDQFVSTPPQIDAIGFLNRGTMQFGVSAPFDFQNTLNYTNRGNLQASPGWRFDHTDELGFRDWADNFINDSGGLIQAVAGGEIDGGIFIDATNIVNRGRLIGSTDSSISIVGKNVDLSRGLTSIAADISGRGDFITRDGFFPENGIYDLYWGVGEVGMNLASLMSISARGQVNVTTPAHSVTNEFQQEFETILRLGNVTTFIYSNQIAPSNNLYQAIFVRNGNTNISVDAFWLDDNPAGGKSAVVRLTTTSVNPLTLLKETRELYVLDTMASRLNGFVTSNLLTETTFRPTNYRVSKVPLIQFDLFPRIRANLAPPPKDLFTTFYGGYFTNGGKWTNQISTNAYSGYQFYSVDGTAGFGRVPTPDAGTPDFLAATLAGPTNVEGRLFIDAVDLNLEKAKLQGAGAVVVRAENLLSSVDTLVDSPVVYFDLGRPGGDLTVKNLAANEVSRLFGQVSLFSAFWSNYVETTITNVIEDAGGGAAAAGRGSKASGASRGRLAADPGDGSGDGGTTEPQTEVVTLRYDGVFHVLVVDAQLLSSTPVEVNGFVSRSKTTTIKDFLRITDLTQVDSEALTIDGLFGMTGAGVANDWSSRQFPALRFLTNNGYILVPQVMRAGTDRSAPYSVIEIRGTNIAGSHFYNSEIFDHRGTIIAGFGAVNGRTVIGVADKGTIEITAKEATLDTSLISSLGEMSLKFENARMRSATIRTDGNVRLDVSGSFRDSGYSAANRVSVGNGFSLASLPKSSELLGTTFETTLKKDGASTHEWAGADLGAIPAGFSNNAAIGRLVINGEAGSRFTFKPVGSKNALYVDYLQVSPAVVASLDTTLAIDPNFTIYFANANVPLEQLDGAVGGRLRRVSNFAGPTTSVQVRLPSGQVVTIPSSVRESLVVDSDGDGIANGQDLSPFDGAHFEDVQLINKPPLTAVIRWRAAAGARYELEYATDMVNPQWKSLKSVQSQAATTTLLSAEDPVQDGPRYYRLRFNPLDGIQVR